VKRRVMMTRPVVSTQGDYVKSAIGDATPSSAMATATPTTDGTSLSTFVDSDNAKMAGAAALAYHGYKRSSGSLLWTAFYALMGHWKPQYAVPVALAQGFGRRKVCTTVED